VSEVDVALPLAGLILLIIIMLWTMVWTAIALWKSARNRQIAWFIVLFILNTMGILEIVYLAFFQKNKAIPLKVRKTSATARKKTRKKNSKKK